MGRFVLVDDEQVPVSPNDAAEHVRTKGFKAAAVGLGFSESTLRIFLKRNGYVAKQTIEKADPFPQEYPATPEQAAAASGS